MRSNALELKHGLYWITEEQFMHLAHVDLDRGTNKAHLDNSVARFSRDSATRFELGNLVHDAENYILPTLKSLRMNKLLAS